MLLIHCPYCEEARPELEFRHAGEAHVSRPAATETLDDEAVAESLYIRTNNRGIVLERWRHIHGCGRFFNAARHSVTDKFYAFYKAGEAAPAIDEGADWSPALFGAGANPGVAPKLGATGAPDEPAAGDGESAR